MNARQIEKGTQKMNLASILALIAGILLAGAMLGAGVGVTNWQFWLAGIAVLFAVRAGQLWGRQQGRAERASVLGSAQSPREGGK